MTTEDLISLLKHTELKESPRSVWVQILAPLQAQCVQHTLPDLSALIILKPRARVDTGMLLKPADAWWNVYIKAGLCKPADIPFWFGKFRAARDYQWSNVSPF